MDCTLPLLQQDRATCVCGAPREDIHNRIYKLWDRHDFVTPGYFYCCAACGTLSAVSLKFNPDSYGMIPIENYSIPDLKWAVNRARVAWIAERTGAPFPAGPVVYDLGAGEGCFTSCFLDAFPGAQILAVEQDTRLRERFANEYHGAEFVPELIEPFLAARATEEPRADLIILTDVLEHVVEPEMLLRLISAALKPSGYAYITVPNSDSYGNSPQPAEPAAIDWELAGFTCQHLWMMRPMVLNQLMNSHFTICELSRSFETNIRRDSDYSTFLVRRS